MPKFTATWDLPTILSNAKFSGSFRLISSKEHGTKERTHSANLSPKKYVCWHVIHSTLSAVAAWLVQVLGHQHHELYYGY